MVRIQGTTREYNTHHSANFQAFFVLAEVNLQIIKGTASTTIFEGVFSEKGSHTLNTQEAARAAYQATLYPITTKIIEIINQ